jgi:hypothetical protein
MTASTSLGGYRRRPGQPRSSSPPPPHPLQPPCVHVNPPRERPRYNIHRDAERWRVPEGIPRVEQLRAYPPAYLPAAVCEGDREGRSCCAFSRLNAPWPHHSVRIRIHLISIGLVFAHASVL